jgi:hypothetical protein
MNGGRASNYPFRNSPCICNSAVWPFSGAEGEIALDNLSRNDRGGIDRSVVKLFQCAAPVPNGALAQEPVEEARHFRMPPGRLVDMHRHACCDGFANHVDAVSSDDNGVGIGQNIHIGIGARSIVEENIGIADCLAD